MLLWLAMRMYHKQNACPMAIPDLVYDGQLVQDLIGTDIAAWRCEEQGHMTSGLC